MTVLVLGLYAEGSTDTRFLSPLIQRTAEKILGQYGLKVVDVADPIIIPKKQGRQEKSILQAALDAYGFHALLVHADADYGTRERALQERIQPGFKLVSMSTQEVCKDLIPIIPVQMTEAWMIADPETLCKVIGTDIKPENSGLPRRSVLVEQDANPKDTLNQFVRRVNNTRPRSRRQIDITTRYELLARQISIDRLDNVPSFRQFVTDLVALLAKFQFVEDENIPIDWQW